MINLHQLFRAFSRVSTPPDSCYSPVSSSTDDPSPFVGDAAATFPAAPPAPVPAAPLGAGVAASAAVGAPAAAAATSAPVPAAGSSLPVAAALAQVAAASRSPPSMADREERGTEAAKKQRSGTWEQEDFCSGNHPFLSADAAPPPDVASSPPLSPSCSTASAEIATALAAAATTDVGSQEYIEAGGTFAGCGSSGSLTDNRKAGVTDVHEMQQQPECCSTRDTATGATAAAVSRCFRGSTYDSAAAAAAALRFSSRGSHPPPLLVAGSQPSSAAAAAAVPFIPQESGATPSALLDLISRLDSSSTTSSNGSVARSSGTKNDISEERSSLIGGEISGSSSTSCSTSTSSSNSPTTSTSNSPTTSCLDAALGNGCSSGRDTHSFSLSLSSAAAGTATAASDKEVMQSPLLQQKQHTAASAQKRMGLDQQQQEAVSAAREEAASPMFESTTATLVHAQPPQEKLNASAALAAALAAVEAAKLQRAVESEKTQQQQQQRGQCLYGEDSSGDSTAEASPACADFLSLLKKQSSHSSDEDERSMRSPVSRLSPAGVAPASPPPPTEVAAAAATAAAAAPPPTSSSLGEASASTAGVARMAPAAALGGAAVAALAAGPNSTVKDGGTTAAAGGGTAVSVAGNAFAAAAIPLGEALFLTQQQASSAAAVKTLSDAGAEVPAEAMPSGTAAEAGDCTFCTGLNFKSPEATTRLVDSSCCSSSTETGSYKGISGCSSADQKSKIFTLQQQEDMGAPAAGKTEVGVFEEPAKAAQLEAAEVAADAEAGTVTPATTAAAASEGDALNAGGNAGKEDRSPAARDAEGGRATAEGCIVDNRGSRRDCTPSGRLGESRVAAAAAAAAVVTSVPSDVAAAGPPQPADRCVGSAAAAEAPEVDGSSCFGFLNGEAAETRGNSNNSSCNITVTTGRSRSNTSTSSDDCSGTDRCFSASLAAAAGSLDSLSAATTRAGPGEEGTFSNVQLQQQQQQQKQVAEESARLLCSAFPAAAPDACSIAEKLKLLAPLTNGSSTSRSLALWGLDQTATAACPAAADATAAAAVATWFSSLLPQQQQQLYAAASAALLPGLLLQPNVACSSYSPLASCVPASGAPVTCPRSEKLSTAFSPVAAKEKATSAAPAHATESLCALPSEERDSPASVPAVGEVPREAPDASAAAGLSTASKEAEAAAATQERGHSQLLRAQGETRLTPPAAQKQQVLNAENHQEQQLPSSIQQQQQVTSPVESQTSSAPRQQVQPSRASAAAVPRAAVVAGVNGSSAYLLNNGSGRDFLPTAAAAANVSPAAFASSCASSSTSASSAASLSPPPRTAVACVLPPGLLSSSLLLSSAAASPFPPLSLLSSLPSAAPASSKSPVVAAVARSLDAAARSTLFASPAPGVPAAAGTTLLLPASAATVAARTLHTDGLAATLPATPVLTAAAGALFPAAVGTSSCVTSPSTAATPALSSLHPLAAFRSATATPPVRLQQHGTTPATAGQQLVHHSGKDFLLTAASSSYSPPSSSVAPSLSSFPTSSASPSFVALASPALQGEPRSSRVLPPLLAKATPSLLQSNTDYDATAALLDRKPVPFTATSPRHGAASSSTPAAGAAASTSAVRGSNAAASASAVATAGVTLAATAAAGTPAAAEKQFVLPAGFPFSPSTVSASAFSSPSPTPLGGPATSPQCGSDSSGGNQPALPLLSQNTSGVPSSTTAGVAAPALQLQQPDPVQASSNAAPEVESTSAAAVASEIPADTSQPAAGAAATCSAVGVASSAGTSSLDTPVGASPFGGVVDSGFWGTTAQQLLLQLNMQQLQHHEQQQQGQLSLETMSLSSPGAFLPPLCISPLAAAAAVVADSSSARPFNLARVHQQQVAAAAAARTAALLQEAAARGNAAAALRGTGGGTPAAAANATAAAHNNNLPGLLAVAAATKKVHSTPLPPFASVQTSVDNCQRQQQQQQQQSCGSAEAKDGEAKSAGIDNKTLKQEGDSTRGKSSVNQTKWAHEQQIQGQQSDKQLPVKQQQQELQLQITKQQSTSGEGIRFSGVEGPPVKRARRGGGTSASTVDFSVLSVSNSSSNDCPLAVTTSAPAHGPSLLKSSVDAATLKRIGAAAVADRGPLFASPAAAASFVGVQQQLLAQLQQNQLLLQSAASSGERYLFDSRLTMDCAPLSESAVVATQAAATAACMGTSAAMQQGFRYFVESLSSPSVAALSAASGGAATGETGAASLTAAGSSGQVLSALLTSRPPHGAPAAAASLAACLSPPPLLPSRDIREKTSNAKDAAAAAALHFQTLQQLHRLHLHPQQQQHQATSAACSFGTVGCLPAGATAAHLRGKSSYAVALPLSQQQPISLSSGSSITHAAVAATGGKVLPNDRVIPVAVTRSSNAGATDVGANREGRATDTGSAAGGNTTLRGGGGGPRQQKRPPRQEQQQQRQQQRQATSLQRQEQNAALQGVHQHHPGVCYSPPKDVWRARITVEGRQHEQQFSVKRHGFEEARLLAVQWRSQMERLRLGSVDGVGGGTAAGGGGSGVEVTAAAASSGAKAKGATGTSKASTSSSMNSLISTSRGTGSSTTHSFSSSSSSTNVVQYLVCNSSSGSIPAKGGLPNNVSGQQDIAKRNSVPVAAQPQQQDFATSMTTCCSDPTYRNFSNISQLTALSSSGGTPVSSPPSSTSATDSSVGLLNADPLSQMRALALNARHLMNAKNFCAMQHPSNGVAGEDSNNAACSTAILFPSPLLSLLDATAAAGGGEGKATAAPAAGGALGLVAPVIPAADSPAPPAPPPAAGPALAARSRPAAAGAGGCC